MFTVQRLVSDLSGTWLVLQVVALAVTVARVMPARTTEIDVQLCRKQNINMFRTAFFQE